MGALFAIFRRPQPKKPKNEDEYKSYVGKYGIVKTIGKGASCKVKLAFTKDT